MKTADTPATLGYRMPAEWEGHDGVWLSWPHDPATFPNRIERVESTYVEIIEALSGSEHINLLVKDETMQARVLQLLSDNPIDSTAVTFHLYDYRDVWFRDYGPIFIIDSVRNRLAMVNWIFNAWGGKYKGLEQDTDIPDFMNKKMRIPCFAPGIVLEGGSIDVNGMGTLLTTEQCLLNRNRNPSLSRKDIEYYLMDYLGISNVIWLKNGIGGDDTDGHIDDIARFVAPSTILCSYEENKDDGNYSILRENYEILCNSKDQDGNAMNIIKLPTPGYITNVNGRLPASYANFYIGNNVVLVPTFSQENDDKALETIRMVFPDRRIRGINCIDLVYGLGTIHCITQQQPALKAQLQQT